jgi:hypothetical protein
VALHKIALLKEAQMKTTLFKVVLYRVALYKEARYKVALYGMVQYNVALRNTFQQWSLATGLWFLPKGVQQSAIWCLLFQFPVSSCFLKVIH